MAKISIDIKDEPLIFQAFLRKYPMPDAFKKPEDWIKEKFRRDIKMIVQEYVESNVMLEANTQVNEILKNAKDSIIVKDDITE